jgi:hypothetical protein
MIKKLLSVAVISTLALSAAASIPCPIKHNNAWGYNDEGQPRSDGNGLYYDPSGSGSAEESLNGTVIHCVANSTYNSLYDENSGFQLQTASIKSTTDDLKITKDHVIVAIDYKTNYACNDGFWAYVIYNNNFDGTYLYYNKGQITTVSDEWQTMYIYIPVKGSDGSYVNTPYGRAEDFGIFSDDTHTGSDYLWLRFNSLLAKELPDFWIDLKNSRWLTMAEMETELASQSLKGDQPIFIDPALPNTDLSVDQADGKLYFTYPEGAVNGLINLFNPTTRLYPDNRIFKIEYQVLFADENTQNATFGIIAMKFINQLAGYNTDGSSLAVMDAKYALDNEEDEWGEISIDFTGRLSDAYTANPISNQGLWLQFYNTGTQFPHETTFSFRNARWTSATSGIADIAADAADGVATYYNLQGVQVANPTNGLYIKKQGNTTSKVLLK